MKVVDFVEMMKQDNETRPSRKKLFADIIDCMEIALSQASDDVEVDGSKTLDEMYKLIGEKAREKGNDGCCGPFMAAEVIAKYLGVSFVRNQKRFTASALPTIDLDDL